ncbi:uncharacterized protein FIESC28_05320 [Fusarium coffeatum]|uniref:Uncharacterized protein n=1 Tax=Fusarium coffeatum TaxID=231269 RepID=A0A366RV64_9HYPO|nr:uncharacterized protein FIESC28_05320 [Fusarium coffeatum]RBR20356.1 hypothetical protein FIESC28_05320 [Fusarium coffeatum]
MKVTTFAATLLTVGFAAYTAAAACCNVKVCDGFGLKGNCKNGCYPYRKYVNINRSGLRSSIGSGKTGKECACTFGKDNGSCMVVDVKGKDAPSHCLTGINRLYCWTK